VTTVHDADGLVVLALLWLPLVALAIRANAEEAFTVDASFPGGNVIVDRIDGDFVALHQDVRDTAGHWFWWHFRVRGAAGRTLTFYFTRGNVLGVRGPAVSTDGGKAWSWLGAKAVEGNSFRYTFPKDAQETRFCFAMPYFEANLKAFLRRYAGSSHLRTRALCTTKKGRTTERLHAGKLDGEPDCRVLVTARHHACECMASYSIEGIIETVLGDTDAGKWLREHVEFLIVPFMDKDGVEDGDQGKNRKPRDHNRDYDGESVYPSVRAVRKLVPEWSEGRLKVHFDLHCPHIRGAHNEVIYMVGNHDEAVWEQQQAFGKVIETVQKGPLVYRASDNLPFGQAWNTAKNYGGGKSSSRWGSELEGIRLATSFEIPYANARGREVTAESARAFGRDLAAALQRYLTQPE